MLNHISFALWYPSLKHPPLNDFLHYTPSISSHIFLPSRSYPSSTCQYIDQYRLKQKYDGWFETLPMRAQFLVLGILRTSHSITHPQYMLKLASHMRYIEYELLFPPSPPKFNLSTNSSAEYSTPGGNGYNDTPDRSYLASNDQAQHGILM